MNSKSETFEIEGMRVDLIRVPVRRYEWSTVLDGQAKEASLGRPKEQALYEVIVDGQLVGRASRPHGWGRQSFHIEDLREPYNSVVYGDGYQPEGDRLYTLERVAAEAAKLRREKFYRAGSRLPTETEWKAYAKAEKRRQERDEAAALERRIQWDREREEAHRLAEEQRMELLGGLQSIDERLGVQLTNYEASALRAAIHAALKSEH